MSIAVEERTIPVDLRQAQRVLERRLRGIRRRLRLHLLVEGLFWVTTAVLVATAVTFALDCAFRFNLPTRYGLLAVAVAAILYVVARKLVRPLLLLLAPLDLAELLDRRVQGVGQKISNVLQLPDLLRDEHYASPSMVRMAVIDCAVARPGESGRHAQPAAPPCGWLLACCLDCRGGRVLLPVVRAQPACGRAAGWRVRRFAGRKRTT